MAVICAICYSRLLSHSWYLKCYSCERHYHINCLTFVTKHDSIYIDRDNNNWLCTKCTSDIFPFNHYDEDVEFIHTLVECLENELNIMKYSDNYKNRLFMPFENSKADFTHLLDFDPDINFYQNLNNNCINKCDYYYEDSMNKSVRNWISINTTSHYCITIFVVYRIISIILTNF